MQNTLSTLNIAKSFSSFYSSGWIQVKTVVWQIILTLAAVGHAASQFGSYAIPPVLPDGHLAVTPEVAAAKAADYNALAQYLGSPTAAVLVAPATISAPVASRIESIPVYSSTAATAAPVPAIASAPVAAPAVPTPVSYSLYYNAPFAITSFPDGYFSDVPEAAAAKAHLSAQINVLEQQHII